MDNIKGFSITIEKDGLNESVYNTKKYRLYIEGKILDTSDCYKDIKERLIKLLDAAFS